MPNRTAYAEHWQLAAKIEEGERTTAHPPVVFVSAWRSACASISVYFFVQKFNIPTFHDASMLTSGVMLGLKVAPVMALPALWGRE